MPPATPALRPRRPAPAGAAAFTLVELLVTTAIVVVLMAAVAGVFKVAGDTVGTGAALASITRDARAAQTTFRVDFDGLDQNGPYLVIDSTRDFAFTSSSEEKADLNFVDSSSGATRTGQIRTIDRNGDGTEDYTTPVSILNTRNHRLDRIAFFSRGEFQRKTGDDGTFVSPTASSEALIRYQPMRQRGNNDKAANANTTPRWYTPGQEDVGPTAVPVDRNDNNRYASQWLLGRSSILLREDAPSLGEQYFWRDAVAAPAGTTTGGFYSPKPLNADATSKGSASPVATFESNRYDLAQTSIRGYADILRRRAIGGTYGGAAYPRFQNWWNRGDLVGNIDAYPFVSRPVTSASVAQAQPTFLQAVSQFTVEFAGDFVAQQNDPSVPGTYGNVTGVSAYVVEDSTGKVTSAVTDALTGTDGVIDYYVVNGQRKTRWYGLPRDIDGDGAIPTSTNNNVMTDVLPLRDVIRTLPAAAGATRAPMERLLPTFVADYSVMNATQSGAFQYLLAWGPGQMYGRVGDKPLPQATSNDLANLGVNPLTQPFIEEPPTPKMIRITLTLVDPKGGLNDGQTFQFVYNLP